jgi:hypothetical protein
MLGRTKSSGRMLADPELPSLLDLHSCEASLQADRIERGSERSVTRASMEATHGT